ncbi:MAG: hypothetical protein JO126_06130 [Alphaproteobacteria bacterium]|nr:hypothetical protein [Alphaproteobacteria bacterium]MBV8549016.1 hypothetical protein [Alphaproteobacteria bacterium]
MTLSQKFTAITVMTLVISLIFFLCDAWHSHVQESKFKNLTDMYNEHTTLLYQFGQNAKDYQHSLNQVVTSLQNPSADEETTQRAVEAIRNAQQLNHVMLEQAVALNVFADKNGVIRRLQESDKALATLNTATQPPEVGAGQWLDILRTQSGNMGDIISIVTDTSTKIHSNINDAIANIFQAETYFTKATIAVLAATLLALIALFYAARRHAITPIEKIIEQLDHNHSERDIHLSPYDARQDEIGILARAIVTFHKHYMDATDAVIKAKEEETHTETNKRIVAIQLEDALEFEINKQVGTLQEACKVLNNNATLLQSQSAQIADSSSDAKMLTREMQDAVMAIKASTDNISSTIGVVLHDTRQSTDITHKAVSESHVLRDRMNVLTEATQQISSSLTVIHKIAAQTRMLALNATIEAARAGDFGRSFAVVAQEVRVLSGQTEKAAYDISTHIQNIQGQTGQALEEVKTITDVIAEIDKALEHVLSSMTIQENSTHEIVENTGRAVECITEVTGSIAKIGDSTRSAEKEANEVANSAQTVTTHVDTMRGAIQQVLQNQNKSVEESSGDVDLF